jgi:hypothetical protein
MPASSCGMYRGLVQRPHRGHGTATRVELGPDVLEVSGDARAR